MATHLLRIPTLLLAAAALPALELAEGLTFGGYGEASARAEHRDRNSPFNTSTTTPPGDQTYVDFSSDAAFKLRYKVDDFTLRTDLIASSDVQFGNDHLLLEQAFIDWAATPNLTVRAGRFQNTWLGWEGFHTPEQFRVNHSAAWDWNVTNHGGAPARPFVSDGAGVILANVERTLTAEFYVVNDVLGDAPGQQASDKAGGASFAWRAQGFGRVELGVAYDRNAVITQGGGGSDALGADFNVDVTALRESGWFFAAEVQLHRHPHLFFDGELYGNDLVALAMANWDFSPGVASATLMLDYVERGFHAHGNELMEYCVAILTKPHKQVRLNGELFYRAETAHNADSYGGAAVILVELP
ncbi:MAG: hypothetical protein H0X38_04705 [Planctomycetes bacterium]|nr:hypothetical protein [Planctomycetota bacterium]